MPTAREPLQYTLRLLQCGSLAVQHRVALCALGAKAVHHKGVRLVQVRAALQRSVGRDSSDSWARRRCIAAALLCTDVRLAMLKRQLSGLVGGVELKRRDGALGACADDVFVRCFQKGLLNGRYAGVLAAAHHGRGADR